MKNIELNIGLSSKTLGTINPIEVLNALTGAGFTLLAYRVVPSACADGGEDCLAVQATAPREWEAQLDALAVRYGQDCIAVTLFAGPAPYKSFVAKYWKTSVPVPSEMPEATRNYITWLEECLIPDLEESGREATADDFRTCIEMIRAAC